MGKELELKFMSPLSQHSVPKSLQIDTVKIYRKNLKLYTAFLSIFPVTAAIVFDPINFVLLFTPLLFGWMGATFRDEITPSTRKAKKFLASHRIILSKEEGKILKNNLQASRYPYVEKEELNVPIEVKNIGKDVLQITVLSTNDFTTTFYNALTAKNHKLVDDVDESKVVENASLNSKISHQLEKLRVSLASDDDIGYTAVMNEKKNISITFTKVESKKLFENMREYIESDFRSRLDESVPHHQV